MSWYTRRVEIAELRDRAVRDAQLIERLRHETEVLAYERDTAQATITRITAQPDQATARCDDLDRRLDLLAAAAHALGVTCIYRIPDASRAS